MLQVAGAFIRKDLLEDVSYRFNFILGWLGILVTLVFLGAVSDFIGEAITDRMGQFRGNYLEFLVLGIGLYGYLDTAVTELSRRIRLSQTVGTLEALLATRTSLSTLILCIPLYPLLQTTVRLAGYLILGALFFELELEGANWPAAILIFLLSFAVFGSVGLIFAALTVAFKRTEPVIFLFNTASALLGGVYFPVEVLPSWLQAMGHVLPLTASLRGIRGALLGGQATEALILPTLVPLGVFLVLLFPLGVIVFRWSLRRAMRDGTLTQY